MRRAVQLVVLAAVTGLASACGGTERDYDAGASRQCLREAGLPVDSRDIGFLARTAPAALHVKFPDNELTIAFGEDVEDGERLERAYRRFAPKRIRPLAHVLKRHNNAVLVWAVAPSPQHESSVVGCLST